MTLLILLGVIIGFTVFLVAILHDPETPEPHIILAEPELEPEREPMLAEPAFYEQVGPTPIPRTQAMDAMRPGGSAQRNPHVIDLRDHRS